MIHSFAQFSLNMLLAINQYKTSIQCSAWQKRIQKRLISSQHAVAGRYLVWPDSTWMSIYKLAQKKTQHSTKTPSLIIFNIKIIQEAFCSKCFHRTQITPRSSPRNQPSLALHVTFLLRFGGWWSSAVDQKLATKPCTAAPWRFGLKPKCWCLENWRMDVGGEVVWWRKFHDIHTLIYIYTFNIFSNIIYYYLYTDFLTGHGWWNFWCIYHHLKRLVTVSSVSNSTMIQLNHY